MTRPNPTLDLTDRPFSVHFSKQDSPDRRELERFISDIFRQEHGTEIKRFKPYLMSLRGHDDNLIAACGLHSAVINRLFLEHYLDQPIEAALSTLTGSAIKRNNIVEIGNFSVAKLDMTRYLITAINDQLHFTSKQWAVLTAIPALCDLLLELGVSFEVIADADSGRLPSEERMEWGNYFELQPRVIAIQRIERRSKPRLADPGSSSP